MVAQAQVVTVSLEDLTNGTVSFETLQRAFGPDSLGILIVKDVPIKFPKLRRLVLSYASYLGNLPAAELAGERRGQIPHRALIMPTAPFTSIRPSNAPGRRPGSLPRPFPSTWLPILIIDVAVLVARACDRYAERDIYGYPRGYLEHVVRTSNTTKARLLHYFPREADAATTDDDDDKDDDWCATHVDHGCLTGLTSAMFVDERVSSPLVPSAVSLSAASAIPPLVELASSPDPSAGLYIKSRAGETVHVRIPRDCIAFQTGEALERITAGRFKAVPHFVRGPRAGAGDGRVARNTLAVFTQPNLAEIVDRECQLTFGEFARGVVAQNTVA
ncbi:hypothetical protein XA68_15093 [Ophiocordyceps unilateralis]|uniref:Isopenicillin N synthase-like Fe(2+) 2OG dioxygenase domain-containing protein n=1 Tax=Ophiocordyceps unilateralis TaxID=268505 RepID=A0A2A9P966_OPHUN|nr:hypothetical protein XA68_15093 [Ophiocordyceps unilateralis]